MVRDVEKLLKVERLGEAPELSIDTCKVVPTTPILLNLVNIEECTEPKINANIDLGLDQLEEGEE